MSQDQPILTECSIDRSEWRPDAGPGPWDDEPDYRHWVHAATGLDCLIVRNHMGALCGYVGVSEGHPWHGVGYDDIEERHAEAWVPSHGGLTYASACSGDICHAADHEGAPTWWVGFDCGHAGDLLPSVAGMLRRLRQESWYPARQSLGLREDVYRELQYVAGACEDLAAFAAGIS